MQTYITDEQIDNLYSIFEHMCDQKPEVIALYIESLRSLASIIDLDHHKFEEMSGHPLMSEEEERDALENADVELMLFNKYIEKQII